MTFLLGLVAFVREVLPCFWSILSSGGLALNPVLARASWRLPRDGSGQSRGCRRIPVLLEGGRLCCHGLWSVPLSHLEMESGGEARTELPRRQPRLLKDHRAASQPGEALRQQSREQLSCLTARHSHSPQDGPEAVASR